jgi:quercetin dioxygenase-like cupin family protein
MKKKKKTPKKKPALNKLKGVHYGKKDKRYRIEDFTRGWLVGNFTPAILKSDDFEFMVRFYKKGEVDPKHVHIIAHEITVVVSGRHSISGTIVEPGDIVHLKPGIIMTRFECLEDGALAVIKTPSVKGDKYLLE